MHTQRHCLCLTRWHITQCDAFFFPSPAPTVAFFLSGLSSPGILVVFEAPFPSNVHIWSSRLSCETPTALKLEGSPHNPTHHIFVFLRTKWKKGVREAGMAQNYTQPLLRWHSVAKVALTHEKEELLHQPHWELQQAHCHCSGPRAGQQ